MSRLEEEDFKEVICSTEMLSQAKSLLPPQITPDDTWEQSQESNNVSDTLDSVDMSALSTQKAETESQDRMQCESESSSASPLHTDTSSGFGAMNESPKRRLSDCSIESSPKRRNYGSSADEKSSDECHVVPKLDDNIPTSVNELSFDNSETQKRINNSEVQQGQKVEETRHIERNCWQFKRESLSTRLPGKHFVQLFKHCQSF